MTSSFATNHEEAIESIARAYARGDSPKDIYIDATIAHQNLHDDLRNSALDSDKQTYLFELDEQLILLRLKSALRYRSGLNRFNLRACAAVKTIIQGFASDGFDPYSAVGERGLDIVYPATSSMEQANRQDDLAHPECL